MKEKIKIGILGCGEFSMHFVPLFKEHPFVEKVPDFGEPPTKE